MLFAKKKSDEKDKNEEEVSDLDMLLSMTQDPGPQTRVTGIYGDITEEKCSEALYSLYVLRDSGTRMELSDPEDPESDMVQVVDPIDFIISTYGGSAADMFAVYDIMRMVRDDCAIRTYGIGKVMSAGVLLLAAGTKGQRTIGANCRVMIHGVISGQQGNLLDMQNEFEESKMTQRLYISAMASETNMTEAYLRKLIKRKTNVYFNAEEAVELGIADLII
jgi:ATP-dependent Clp endopeptidase proteolytic subunit ClpP